MQTTITGETTLTGSLRQQLEEVNRNGSFKSPKEIRNEWFYIKHGLKLTDEQMNEILSADRVSRDVFNQN